MASQGEFKGKKQGRISTRSQKLKDLWQKEGERKDAREAQSSSGVTGKKRKIYQKTASQVVQESDVWSKGDTSDRCRPEVGTPWKKKKEEDLSPSV